MWKLLRPDLLAVGNAFARRDGRKTLGLALLGYASFALVGVLIGGRLLGSKPVLDLLRESPDEVAAALLAVALWVPLVLVTPVALAECQVLLFTSPAAELLLVAPVSRTAIVARALARTWWTTILLQCLLALPAIARCCGPELLNHGVLAAYPAVSAALLLPACAAMIATSVVILRFASSPRLKLVVNVVGVVVGILLTVAVAMGFVAGRRTQRHFARELEGAELPEWMLWPGACLARAAGVDAPGPAWWLALGAPLLALPFALFAAWLYPAAFERRLVAGGRRVRRSGAQRRWWPGSVTASVAWKDLLVTLQTKANIAGFAFLGAIAVAFVASDLARGRQTPGLAPELATVLGLATAWQVMLIMVATLQGIGLFSDEARQLDLLSTAPVARRALLRGKAPLLLLPHAFLLAVFAIAAPTVRGASLGATALFVAVAVPITLLALGSIVAVGSLPAANRGLSEAPGTAPAKILLTLVAAVAPGIAVIVGLVKVRPVLADADAGALMLALAWAVGGAVAALGWWLAGRNLERLLGPRG
jgi:hypothetical protein